MNLSDGSHESFESGEESGASRKRIVVATTACFCERYGTLAGRLTVAILLNNTTVF